MKNPVRLDKSQQFDRIYSIFSYIVVIIFAILFTFPLYWIITGSFKTKVEILATEPVWWPSEFVMTNY